MAEKNAKAKKSVSARTAGAVPAKPGVHTVTQDTKALVDHVRENPLLYAAATGFVLLCVVGGLIIGLSRQASTRGEMTQLARAVVNDDPALRAAQLEPLAKASGAQAAIAVYLAGEAEIKAQNYTKAEEYLQRVVSEFPDSEYAPNAMEGLGFLAENKGDLETALQRYKQVMEKWPDSFMARVCPSRVGRVLESLDRKKEAVDAYVDQYRRFPKAWTTTMAMTAMDKLTKVDNAEVSAAAKDGFKKLSQEFPAQFQEQFPQFFVPAEEPAPAPDTAAAATPAPASPDQAAAPAAAPENAASADAQAASTPAAPGEQAADTAAPTEPADGSPAPAETPDASQPAAEETATDAAPAPTAPESAPASEEAPAGQ